MTASAVLLVFSLALMTLGAEALVRGASSLAFRLRLSPLFVGLTVVALGTSSPELTSSLLAVLRGSAAIAVGNVVGSNIFNIAAILGLAALVRPITVHFAAVRRDVLVACGVTTAPWLAATNDGLLPRWVGVSMVLGLAGYTWAAFRTGRKAAPEEKRLAMAELEDTVGVGGTSRHPGVLTALRDLGIVAVGLLLLVCGARWFVDAAIDIARIAGLSELTIGLTIVAIGTSMPELMTSVVAAIRGQTDIAVGNVVGSNIFNVLGVLGVCTLLSPQHVSGQTLWLHTPVMLALSLALLPIVKTGGRISRSEGAVLVASYVAYVGVLLALSA
jgi:cation:H+ antiporter